MKAFKIAERNLRNKKYFSTVTKHSQVIVIGAGTGGLAVSSQLKRQCIVAGENITIFDPAKIHYYQPGFTKIGGGIINNMHKIEYDTSSLTEGFNFQNVGIKSIDPDNNSVETEGNEKWTYDHLIIAAGLEVKLDSIPGLKPLMDDPTKFVGTIYDPLYAQKVSWMRENFKGGKALFTQPPAPLKCGGAPQKILYLCEDYWKKKGIKADIHFYTPLPQMFAVKYFSDYLQEEINQRGVSAHFTTVLTSVRDGVATFKNASDGTTFEQEFDFLHAVPLLNTPQFLHGSLVSNASGLVDVNRSMRHNKYSNIWAIGDCTSLPNAKTAAAVFSQAPVLVHNLENEIKHNDSTVALYDGYSSCPLYLKKGNLLLAEFTEYHDEKGNPIKGIDESFHPGKQNLPRELYYWVSYCFTLIYSLGLKGLWYGKHSFFKPNFKNEKNTFDVRKYYKFYYIPPVLLGVYLLTLL